MPSRKASAFAVAWWFGKGNPTASDISMMTWRIVRCATPVAAVLISLHDDEIASYRNPHPMALVSAANRAPKTGDTIHGYKLNLELRDPIPAAPAGSR